MLGSTRKSPTTAQTRWKAMRITMATFPITEIPGFQVVQQSLRQRWRQVTKSILRLSRACAFSFWGEQALVPYSIAVERLNNGCRCAAHLQNVWRRTLACNFRCLDFIFREF